MRPVPVDTQRFRAGPYRERMELRFEAEVIAWRGPAPFVFAVMPNDEADAIADIAHEASYGWGCIPVSVRLGEVEFTTALIPKDGTYRVPLKKAIQKAAGVGVGMTVRLEMLIGER